MATGKFFRELELPQQKTVDDGGLFPVVLSPNATEEVKLSDLEEAIKAQKPWLESLLQKKGVILLRGFPVSSPSDFNCVIEAFGFPERLYMGGRGKRTKIASRIYTPTEFRLDKTIPFHHEMSYVKDFPTKLFFFCEEEPGKGGETPVVMSHIIYERMKEKHPEFVARLEEHGLTYVKLSSEHDDPSASTGNSWKTAYMTDDKNVAEERAAKQGSRLEWNGNSAKIITGPVPAIRVDEASGRKTWFNSLAVSYAEPGSRNTWVELGNGESALDDAMADCLKIMEEECVAIPWKKGDIMLVNNMNVLHGRRPLLKPPRSILVSLCA